MYFFSKEKRLLIIRGLFFSLFFIPSFLHAATVVKPVSSGLKLHITFDQGYRTSTTVTDTSGQGNNGTISGALNQVAGRLGQAGVFAGGEAVDFGTTPLSLQFANNMSIAFWVRPGASQTTYADIISNHHNTVGYVIEQDASNLNSFIFSWGTGSGHACEGVPIFTLTANVWQHVAIRKIDNKATAYVNGVEQGTCTGPASNIAYDSRNLYLGRWASGGRYFNGSLDDFRMYDRAISIAELKSLANPAKIASLAGSQVGPAGSPVAWWTFDGKDMTGTTVLDKSGNGNTGTLVDLSATSNSVAGKVGQALLFTNSQTDSVTMGPATLAPDAPMSISFWYKSVSTTLDNHGLIRLKGASSEFVIDIAKTGNTGISGSAVYFGFRGSSGIVTNDSRFYSDTSFGKWRHYTVTYNGGNKSSAASWKLFIDGEDIPLSTSGTIGGGSNANVMGIDPGSGYAQGSLDDVRVYHRQLPSTEARSLSLLGKTSVSFGLSTLTSVPVSSGLIAYYPFDGKYMSGTSVSDRAGANAGTMYGGMSAISSARIGKAGQGIYFDGLDDYIDLGNAVLATDTGFSVSFWAKNASSTALNMVPVRLKGTAEFMFGIGESTQSYFGPTTFYFGFRGVGASIQKTDTRYYIDTTRNKWNHYTITYNGGSKTSASSWQLYVNGQRLSGLSTGGNIGNFSNLNELGRDGPGGLSANMSLDDLRIYNRVVTAREALSIYTSTK